MSVEPAKAQIRSIRIVPILNAITLVAIGVVVGVGIMLGRVSPLLVALAAIGAFFKWLWAWLAANKETLSAFKDVATIVGIGAGIWWFFKRRQHMPRLDVSLAVSHHALDDDRMLVSVRATMKNHGVLRVRIVRAYAYIQQVSPPSHEMLAAIKERAPDKPVMQREIPFEKLDYCDVCEPFELEPGETDHYGWDFIAPRDVRTLRAEARFDNERRGGKGQLGWNATALYDVAGDSTPEPEADMSKDDGKFRKGIPDAVDRARRPEGDTTRQQHEKPQPKSIDHKPFDKGQQLEKRQPPPVNKDRGK